MNQVIAISKRCRCPLMLCVVASFLTACGGGNNEDEPSSVSPGLFLTTVTVDVDEATEMLEDDPSLANASTSAGLTALHMAAATANVEFATELIDQGADVNASTSPLGQTPLHLAAMPIMDLNDPYSVPLPTLHPFTPGSDELLRKLEIARMLIEAGADVEAATTPQGGTPLLVASAFRNRPLVDQLVKSGVDVNATTERGRSALFVAAQNGWIDVVRTLLDAGAEFDAADVDGVTPLLAAAGPREFPQQYAITRQPELKRMADEDGDPDSGISQLRFEVLKLLIQRGANVNARAQKPNGMTALHASVVRGHVSQVEFLLNHGAKPSLNVFTEEVSTPLDVTFERGDELMIELLRRHGAKRESEIQ